MYGLFICQDFIFEPQDFDTDSIVLGNMVDAGRLHLTSKDPLKLILYQDKHCMPSLEEWRVYGKGFVRRFQGVENILAWAICELPSLDTDE